MPTNRQVQKEKVAAYTSILLDSAFESGGQEVVLKVRDQMEYIIRTIRANMDLSTALQDDTYTPRQRNDLVRTVFAPFHAVLVGVLAVMAERGDIALLSRMWDSYGQALEYKLDVSVVDVTTVVSLDDSLRALIIEKTAADLGTKVVLREHLDPSLLGGVVLSAHGKRIDASVKMQLESARAVLKLSTNGGECS